MKKRIKQTLTITWLLAIFITSDCRAQNADINLLKSINQHETSFKNRFTSVTAGSVNVVVLAAPLAILTTGLIKKDKNLQSEAAYFAGGYILSAAVTHGLKIIINRPRPFVTYPFIVKREKETSYSFPSGQTSSAFYDAVSLTRILQLKIYCSFFRSLGTTAKYFRTFFDIKIVHYFFSQKITRNAYLYCI